MDKTTIEFGRWRIRRIDSKNWQLFEYRIILSGARAGDVDWVGLDSFHGSLLPALEDARKREFEQSGYTGDLDGAIKAIKRTDREFLNGLRKAMDDAECRG